MALQGTFNLIEYINHPTDTTTFTVIYPADMDENHEHYDKRGTTEDQEIPVQVATSSSYADKYFYVKAASVHTLKTDADFGNTVELTYNIGIYDDQNSKNTDFENPIDSLSYNMEWNWDVHTNPTEEAYNHFKSIGLESSSSLTDI